MLLRICTRQDLAGALERVRAVGAASLWILLPDSLSLLVQEAHRYHYAPQPPVVGTHGVRQHLASWDRFTPRSRFHKLREVFQKYLNGVVENMPPSQRPFPLPMEFTEMVLQKYPIGELGISPHRDGRSNVNLIAVFTLCGTARVAVCADRDGNDAVTLDSRPGMVTLLRAPGFAGATDDDRPFHFVADITAERISFALRQHAPPR